MAKWSRGFLNNQCQHKVLPKPSPHESALWSMFHPNQLTCYTSEGRSVPPVIANCSSTFEDSHFVITFRDELWVCLPQDSRVCVRVWTTSLNWQYIPFGNLRSLNAGLVRNPRKLRRQDWERRRKGDHRISWRWFFQMDESISIPGWRECQTGRVSMSTTACGMSGFWVGGPVILALGLVQHIP